MWEDRKRNLDNWSIYEIYTKQNLGSGFIYPLKWFPNFLEKAFCIWLNFTVFICQTLFCPSSLVAT